MGVEKWNDLGRWNEWANSDYEMKEQIMKESKWLWNEPEASKQKVRVRQQKVSGSKSEYEMNEQNDPELAVLKYDGSSDSQEAEAWEKGANKIEYERFLHFSSQVLLHLPLLTLILLNVPHFYYLMNLMLQ